VGQVTLSTRAFGRGTDFISRDTVLDGIGGLHVVQAFFSEMLSEEIQVMGRTARQGQKGLYSMVLLQQDTLLVDSDGKNQPKPDTLEYFGVTDAELQRVARQDRYSFLYQKRVVKRSVESVLIEANLKIATERDKLTRSYFQLLLRRDPRAVPKFEQLYMTFKAVKGGGGHVGLHVVFCLDESGSMEKLFPELVTAYSRFVGGEHGKNKENALSVIMFSGKVNCICDCEPFSSAPLLKWGGGGTNFSPALQRARVCFNSPNANGLCPVLIFMTDGGTSNLQSALQEMEKLDKELGDLQVHLVGFGGGADVASLNEMKKKTRNGFVHKADIGKLEAKFQEIGEQLAIAEYR